MAEFDSSPPLVLMRGQVPVASFLGTLGGNLRETRITAMIGYLIAHDPTHWKPLFGLSRPISSVIIEADYERDRADIVVGTANERVVVEAKVSWSDPRIQASKYDGNRKYLLTNYIPVSKTATRSVHYITWSTLATFLKNISSRTGKGYVRHLEKELIEYMIQHQLIRTNDSVEIYARELNNEVTIGTLLEVPHIWM